MVVQIGPETSARTAVHPSETHHGQLHPIIVQRIVLGKKQNELDQVMPGFCPPVQR